MKMKLEDCDYMHELFFQKASHQMIKAVVLQVCFPY